MDIEKGKHLFTLRVWQESLGQQRSEWRGEIKHLSNGEVRYFRDAHSLYAALQKLLSEPARSEGFGEEGAAE